MLWRLAEAGCLDRVEHLVAVSGGAYVAAAFASHLVQACKEAESEGVPLPRGADLRQWYRMVVARTLCRMQKNASYFVRDWGTNKPWQRDSFRYPPVLDVVILGTVILYTVLTTPLTYLVAILIPLCEILNLLMACR